MSDTIDSAYPVLFTIGYKGWGPRAEEYIEMLDRIETQRGFKPPFFLDMRIHRSARARGFSGRVFERIAGRDRYQWLKQLGNVNALDGKGYPVRIADPHAADTLCEIVQEKWRGRRRVFVFDGCHFPVDPQRGECHRYVVGKLALKVARKRHQKLQVIEWPGYDIQEVDLHPSKSQYSSILRGRKSISVGKEFRSEFIALPWASIVKLHGDNGDIYRLCSPASLGKSGEWRLSVLRDGNENSLNAYRRNARAFRKEHGLTLQQVLTD